MTDKDHARAVGGGCLSEGMPCWRRLVDAGSISARRQSAPGSERRSAPIEIQFEADGACGLCANAPSSRTPVAGGPGCAAQGNRGERRRERRRTACCLALVGNMAVLLSSAQTARQRAAIFVIFFEIGCP